MHCGYLALKCEANWSRQFFILFENKVLIYYQDRNDVSLIDLRHVMWLRFTKKNEFNVDLERHFGQKRKGKSVYSMEIAVPSRSFILTASSQRIRNGLC